jgi:hypothetical protein
MYIPKALFAGGDALATVHNIVAHESLFRWGIASSLLSATVWMFVPVALYLLFRDVNRRAAQCMVLLGAVMQVPLFFVNSATDVAALTLATVSDVAAPFNAAQRAALVELCLTVHHNLDLANAIFWGLWLLPFGWLVYKSHMLPRVLGLWLMLACLGWLAFSAAGLAFPAYEDRVLQWIQPLTLGEIVTMLWLLFIGARSTTPDPDQRMPRSVT